MEIVEKRITDLTPYENNPRKNNSAVEYIANSIKEFGFKVPIVIDKDNVIVAGHTRYKASKRLKLKTVPCIIANDLTAEQIKAFRLADNKTAELAEWDFDLLNLELADIVNIDMSDFSFDLTEFESTLDFTEDEVPEVEEIKEPICKVGDVWILGKHRLICGDCTDKTVIHKLMNGKKANMAFTDPPYNVDYKGKTKSELTIINDKQDNIAFKAFLNESFANMAYGMEDGASAYICYSSKESLNFINSFNNAGFYFSEQIIWNKNQLVMGRGDYQYKHEPIIYGWKEGASHYFVKDRTQTTVWDIDKPSRSDDHPTMKPIELMTKAINNSSKKGNIILDIFGGSGSTLIACEQTNRVCYMSELDTRYCDVIIKRWENMTNEKAIKE